MKPLTIWLAYAFSLLAAIALGVAAFRQSWFWSASGGGLAVMAIAFLFQGNIARAQLHREREIVEGLRLASALPENDFRNRLYAALSFHFCGLHAANFPLSRDAQRALPPVVATRQRRRRRKRRKRRGGRRGRKDLLLLPPCKIQPALELR